MEVGRSQLSHLTADQAGDLIKLFGRVGLSVDASGNVSFSPALPTADPGVAGALWANTGVVTVSAG